MRLPVWIGRTYIISQLVLRIRLLEDSTLAGKVYHYPRYYDIGFSWDTRRELDFLESCFKRYGRPSTSSVLELGCGTGRLLIGLAKRGYRVIGVDNSHPMVEYLSEKARRLGVTVHVVEQDMEKFVIPEKVDAAFCAINTFRYLLTEKAGLDHLSSVGESLRPGGIYVIDFVLLGLLGSYPKSDPEEWTVDAEGISVKVTHRFLGVPDLKSRRILDEITLTIRDGEAIEKISAEDPMRTYTKEEFESLVQSSGRFRILAWHGPDLDIDKRLEPGPETERVLVILKRHL